MSDSPKLYAVVVFDEILNGKKLVELVPISWITGNETLCFWPPKNLEHKLRELVKIQADADDTWDKYPVEIITKAKDYEQGNRRLQKSFKKRNINSSESESQASHDDQIVIMKSSRVAKTLANPIPLMRDRPIDDIIEELFAEDAITNNTESISQKDKTISESLLTNRQDIVDFNGVATFLEDVIQKEFKKMRQSLELSMTDKFKQLLKTIQYSAEPPAKQKAWQDLGNTLPFDSLETFLAFEESLTNDKQKKNSLIDVFQMITAGSTDCENDVNQIMGKLIKKNIQLLYSGCGKKIKGVGKKSFKDTESFKIMDEFLRAKYHAAQGKLHTISWVSRFLSGAKDREGGRADRGNKNNEVTE